jgi:hypothetical protein
VNTRRRAIAVGLASAMALGLVLIGPVSTPAAAASPISASVPSASAAARANADARALRRDVATLLKQYIDGYGDRFSVAERKQLLGFRADADRQLAHVVLATSALSRVDAVRAPARTRRAAGANARASWRRAKAAADASFESARQIMEPKLSLFEQLSALRDYNTMMDRFDALGTRIDTATRATA